MSDSECEPEPTPRKPFVGMVENGRVLSALPILAEWQAGIGRNPPTEAGTLITTHKLSTPDRLYDLQLKKAVEVANARTLRELGPMPPEGPPVQTKAKPNAPYRMFDGRVLTNELLEEGQRELQAMSDAYDLWVAAEQENDRMKFSQIGAAAALAVVGTLAGCGDIGAASQSGIAAGISGLQGRSQEGSVEGAVRIMSKTCGGIELQLECPVRSGSADCLQTRLVLKDSGGRRSKIDKPQEMAGYTAVGIGCASSAKSGESYFVVQYGELPFGCGFCEWLYLYSSDGRQLTKSQPPLLADENLPGNDKEFANNREFERLTNELGIKKFELDFVECNVRVNDAGTSACLIANGIAEVARDRDPAESGNLEKGIALPPGLQEGMAYADFRNALHSAGWIPLRDSSCTKSVVGGGYRERCETDHDELCRVCADLPELSSCTSNGICLMRFRDSKGNQLDVSTYGDIVDWRTSGPASQLIVQGWEIHGSVLPRSAPASASVDGSQPPSADELEVFVPEGGSILATTEGDLNRDGRADAVIVVDPVRTGKELAGEGPSRIVMLLIRDANGHLYKAKQSATLIPCEKCGGMAGDPFGYVQVKNGTFTAVVEGGSPSVHWSEVYEFDYHADIHDWILRKVEHGASDQIDGRSEQRRWTIADLGERRLENFDRSSLPHPMTLLGQQ